jgi:hypothetical protein
MADPILYRILIVEGQKIDAELIEHEVLKLLPGGVFVRVETRAEYLHALDAQPPDIILSPITRSPCSTGCKRCRSLWNAVPTPFSSSSPARATRMSPSNACWRAAPIY